MKLKYIGKTFYNGNGLTNNKIYECTYINLEDGLFGIIDDGQEEYLYPIKNPRPLDNSTDAGTWEIVEDPNGKLAKALKQ